MGLFPDKELTRGVLKISTPAVAGLSSQVVESVIDTAMVRRLTTTTVVMAAMSLGLPATRAITSVFSSIATVIHVPGARRSGKRDTPGAGDVLDDFLVVSIASGLIFGLPGYQFSYDIINFFNATFPPRYRRTYKYYRRFRIRHEVIRQIKKISLPVSFQNILIFLVFVAIAGIIGTSEQAASQVVITALFISSLTRFGFGVGARTLAEQSLGKCEFTRARRCGLEACNGFRDLPASYVPDEVLHSGILGLWTALPVPIVAHSGLIYLKYAKGSRSHIKT
jgi:Na+-driven multidrug efflux pump